MNNITSLPPGLFELVSTQSPCFGFDLFFDDKRDLNKLSRRDLFSWVRRPENFGFTCDPDEVRVSSMNGGVSLTCKWNTAHKIDVMPSLFCLRAFVERELGLNSSYTGAELYISLMH